MTQYLYIACISLLLAACAHVPQPVVESGGQVSDEEVDTTSIPLPNIELNSELLYELLLSEIASQRGETTLAADTSADLAQKTRDPRLAMRAVQMALRAGQMEKTVESLKIWLEAEPESLLAKRTLASVLLRTGRIDEARDEFASVLKAEQHNVGPMLMQTYQVLAAYPDKHAALKMMRELSSPYLAVVEAHWAVAQLARAAGDTELALSEVRQARKLYPEWDMAASLEAQLLHKSDPPQALEVLRRYLAKYPAAREIRLQYARALLELKQYEPARDQFQLLADENPENPDMAYAIALISMQLKDLTRAEEQLKQALIKGKKDQDTVHYYLGQLAEARESDGPAIGYYRQVKAGEYYFLAQIRIAYLLNKRGEYEEARQHLRQIEAADDQQRIQLVLVEAHLLREAKLFSDAYQLLGKNLERFPEHPELLYETAMMAEKNGKLEEFERLMRKLISIDPEHAHAYNALGYSLLERSERIPEALELVKKAMQLAPDDAAIIDSVGWGYFRAGDLGESVKLLRQAYAANPDPEIAAHLGEVLWMRGERDEARKVFEDTLNANPGNAVLQEVMKRLMP